MRRRLVLVGLAAGLAAVAALLGSADRAQGTSAESGVPERGAAVFRDHQCWSCHALAAAGSTGKSGPDLDRWVKPHAAQLRVTPEALSAARVVLGGRGMPAYARDLDGQQVADVVAFVLGRPVSLPATPAPVPSPMAPPPETHASAAAIARWVRAGRLDRREAKGAAVFGREGCLSCHRFRDSGRSRHGGRDLGPAGGSRLSAARIARYVADPARSGNRLMPAYGDLGTENLAALGAFLAASRTRRG